ncbi:mycofactocin-coupled SDR family oxidoreductase [Mycobacterium senriense]|uniref:Carveol dehydrogenase n=2 Tax=Mycobacterium avium complex (MAC) TaxID=120793 RepID=J9W7X7_MYCIP|nr:MULTISPECIES: mycofactocin-coupled SDR family oxidoreductase [Mycobacterium]AFS12158.1 Carveol dehydrogenase [Mycobacterium intracellulare subsp. intracellulare MTCC 9506]QWY63572.1 mycofactocin-coupled SDR family oxidoreductase [Mycobacterium avium subsp. hominissuis]WSE51379.1 mycofactocin-coupled SDR family oxidoreductase [Mycobacterium sp. 2-64]BCO49739.1 oxidoreductase [Mycobacterium paraintracellulare]BCO81834.1 oxidoreductase [Mycobacterium paraintracellulare]
MTGRVEGKVALITGAARGQGRSHALRLADEGADIIALDIAAQVESAPYPLATPADLDETAREIKARGRRVVARQVDVRDGEALTAAVGEGVSELGRLDIVSANAGILSVGPSFELTEQTWTEMIDINLSGSWRTTKAAIPHMIAAGNGGSIVLTSSIAGLIAQPGLAHYVSAKHGVVGLMKTLALELAPFNIRVNSVHPTNVDTDMIQNEPTYRVFLPDDPNPTREKFAVPATEMNALAIPWIESIDVTNAVLFLASDEARYITGVSLPIDAGASIK